MIEVKELTKKYGGFTALDNVSFSSDENGVLGFLGPNGAGKSTAMNIITGYISSSGGTALIDGADILDRPLAAKRGIGYLPEQPPLYPDMTVREYLLFVYSLKRTKLPKWKHLDEICGLVRIADMADRLISNLSKGYKQRVGFAAALIGNPKTLILDEPTAGLDPMQIIEMRELIKKLGKSHSVIFSSHILPEVQSVSNRIVIINKGRIAAEGSPRELVERLPAQVSVRAEYGDGARLARLLRGIGIAEKVSEGERIGDNLYEYLVTSKKAADSEYALPKRIGEVLYENKIPVIKLNSGSRTLEDVFLSLVR